MIECGEIERLDGFGFPQSQNVAGAYAITGDRRVVSDSFHFGLWNPAHTRAATLVRVGLAAPAEFYRISDFRPREFPRITETQPFIGDLALPAVTNDLIENAELVANAVTDCRHFNRCERIHKTGSKPAKSTVAQAGLFFLRDDFIEIDIE